MSFEELISLISLWRFMERQQKFRLPLLISLNLERSGGSNGPPIGFSDLKFQAIKMKLSVPVV